MQAQENARLEAIIVQLRADMANGQQASNDGADARASPAASSVRTPSLSPTDVWVRDTTWVAQPPTFVPLEPKFPAFTLPPAMTPLFPGLPPLPSPGDLEGRYVYDWAAVPSY